MDDPLGALDELGHWQTMPMAGIETMTSCCRRYDARLALLVASQRALAACAYWN